MGTDSACRVTKDRCEQVGERATSGGPLTEVPQDGIANLCRGQPRGNAPLNNSSRFPVPGVEEGDDRGHELGHLVCRGGDLDRVDDRPSHRIHGKLGPLRAFPSMVAR